jgi:uncharacterized protein
VTIFVDTSAWFAAIFKRDRYNTDAKRLLTVGPLITSDHVVVETWMLIANRLNPNAANTFVAKLLISSTRIEVVNVDDIKAAEAIRLNFSDQSFSLVDRTSFVVAERLGLSRVISFDNDFVIYRYGINRERAFEVLR